MNTNNDSKPGNDHVVLDGFTQKDVERAIAQLAYRKARTHALKLAMVYVRKHPELVREGGAR